MTVRPDYSKQRLEMEAKGIVQFSSGTWFLELLLTSLCTPSRIGLYSRTFAPAPVRACGKPHHSNVATRRIIVEERMVRI